jgi:5-methylthioribose kinase
VLGREADAERLLALPVELVEAFEEEFTRRWPERVDPRVYSDDVLAVTLRRIRSDTAIYAAAKAVRRIVGFSKVADIQTLPEPERALAARRVLQTARTLGVARLIDPDPKRLVQLTREPLLT